MTIIPAFKRYTQEDQEYKASLSSIVSSSIAWAVYNIVSKREEEKVGTGRGQKWLKTSKGWGKALLELTEEGHLLGVKAFCIGSF